MAVERADSSDLAGAPMSGGAARPVLAVSMGDPGGIGPEVLVKALADPALRRSAKFRVLGCASVMHAAAERAGIEPFWWTIRASAGLDEAALVHDVVLVDYEPLLNLRDPIYPAEASKLGGSLSFQFVEDAIALAKRPAHDPLHAHGIVTGPISKAAWALAGRGKYPGHTELLAVRFGVERVGMMFVGPKLRVILVTAHVPLMDIRNALTIGQVYDAIDLGHDACRHLGLARPRIAVCGLNPHAGEGGLLGDEEERLIAPAIELAQRHGIEVSGPHPGDTVFGAALAGKYDLVVAMYHDQGLIPVKLLFRDESVNVTVGLPSVRTSPDHGTAFDIAGKNIASEQSTASAIRLAVRMCEGVRRLGEANA
ncbi:MAG: 4-hydroxythreonine-4-phosphate dehydrogenase PdxA [Phycisphaerales bacterium]|jgi:4-hydroxythreonine-4-phosphate dehydrogenase|nr:4-hydroxythreonine-4-phosphate dehydrogenase PdxA [Phycisphaerales bacterium]